MQEAVVFTVQGRCLSDIICTQLCVPLIMYYIHHIIQKEFETNLYIPNIINKNKFNFQGTLIDNMV